MAPNFWRSSSIGRALACLAKCYRFKPVLFRSIKILIFRSAPLNQEFRFIEPPHLGVLEQVVFAVITITQPPLSQRQPKIFNA